MKDVCAKKADLSYVNMSPLYPRRGPYNALAKC